VHGEPEWSHSFGATGTQSAHALALDPAGNVVVGGEFAGTLSFGGELFEAGGPNDAFLARYDASGGHMLSTTFGDAQDSYVADLAVDGSGASVMVGHYNGVISFGGASLESEGHVDMYIAKLDALGTHQWSRNYGSLFFDQATSVAIAADGAVYVTGFFMDSVDFGLTTLTSVDDLDAFVLKLDATGSPEWIVQLPGPGDQQGFAITVNDDAVWVGGGFDQPITIGADTLTPVDEFDIFIAKLSTADGAISASHALGGTGTQQVNAMTTTNEGAVVLTGTSTIESDTSAALVAQLASDATVAWSLDLGGSAGAEGNAIAASSAGIGVAGTFRGRMTVGAQELESEGEDDAFVALLTADGSVTWSRAYGGTAINQGLALALDSDGRMTLAGRFDGDFELSEIHLAVNEFDAFLARLSP